MSDKKPVRVDAIDLTKETSAINDSEKEVKGDLVCVWNGQRFGEGSEICVQHQILVCNHFGRWVNTHQRCDW